MTSKHLRRGSQNGGQVWAIGENLPGLAEPAQHRAECYGFGHSGAQ
jgi:hypothetical protein